MNLMPVHHMFRYRITDCRGGAALKVYDMILIRHRRSLFTVVKFPIVIHTISAEGSCKLEHGTAHLSITKCILYAAPIYSRDMVPLPLALA